MPSLESRRRQHDKNPSELIPMAMESRFWREPVEQKTLFLTNQLIVLFSDSFICSRILRQNFIARNWFGSVTSKAVTGSGHKTDKKSDSSLKTGASQSQDQHHEINYSNWLTI